MRLNAKELAELQSVWRADTDSSITSPDPPIDDHCNNFVTITLEATSQAAWIKPHELYARVPDPHGIFVSA